MALVHSHTKVDLHTHQTLRIQQDDCIQALDYVVLFMSNLRIKFYCTIPLQKGKCGEEARGDDTVIELASISIPYLHAMFLLFQFLVTIMKLSKQQVGINLPSFQILLESKAFRTGSVLIRSVP